MTTNNTSSASSDSFSGETLAALRKRRTGLVRRKQQLEQAAFDATLAAINTESIDVSQIDLSAWDDFQ
jgi:hypothetical protein